MTARQVARAAVEANRGQTLVVLPVEPQVVRATPVALDPVNLLLALTPTLVRAAAAEKAFRAVMVRLTKAETAETAKRG